MTFLFIAFSVMPRRWSMRDAFSFCECSKCPTLSPSSETVGVSWLTVAKRRSNCCWLLLFAVPMAVSMTLPLSLSLLVYPYAAWFSSPVRKVGPGFGSTPATNNMSSSVVTANRAASPWTRNPLTLLDAIAAFLVRIFSRIPTNGPTATRQNSREHPFSAP